MPSSILCNKFFHPPNYFAYTTSNLIMKRFISELFHLESSNANPWFESIWKSTTSKRKMSSYYRARKINGMVRSIEILFMWVLWRNFFEKTRWITIHTMMLTFRHRFKYSSISFSVLKMQAKLKEKEYILWADIWKQVNYFKLSKLISVLPN